MPTRCTGPDPTVYFAQLRRVTDGNMEAFKLKGLRVGSSAAEFRPGGGLAEAPTACLGQSCFFFDFDPCDRAVLPLPRVSQTYQYACATPYKGSSGTSHNSRHYERKWKPDRAID